MKNNEIAAGLRTVIRMLDKNLCVSGVDNWNTLIMCVRAIDAACNELESMKPPESVEVTDT